MNNEILTSPVGNIKFCALSKPVKTYDGTKDVYKIRLEFDGSKQENKDYKAKVESVNKNKVTTNGCEKGNFAVNFVSTYAPTITDADGNEAPAPYFDGRTDKGTAVVQSKVDTRGKQGTLHLMNVGIVSLDLAEREEGSGSGTTLSELKAALRKAVA